LAPGDRGSNPASAKPLALCAVDEARSGDPLNGDAFARVASHQAGGGCGRAVHDRPYPDWK
jgi:hypothetical protein